MRGCRKRAQKSFTFRHLRQIIVNPAKIGSALDFCQETEMPQISLISVFSRLEDPRGGTIRARFTRARAGNGAGEAADRYIADLYAVMQTAAANPETGRSRQHRGAPFLTIPAPRHFVIHDLIPRGIAVLTIQHQVRDIETLIQELTPAFLAEVGKLKRASGSPAVRSMGVDRARSGES
jgi:plasmid stabilization system protein ParE